MNDGILIGERIVSIHQVSPEEGEWPPLVLSTEKGWYQVSPYGIEKVANGSGGPVDSPSGCSYGAIVEQVRAFESDIWILLDSGWMIHSYLAWDPFTDGVWAHVCFDSPEETLEWKQEFDEIARLVYINSIVVAPGG